MSERRSVLLGASRGIIAAVIFSSCLALPSGSQPASAQISERLSDQTLPSDPRPLSVSSKAKPRPAVVTLTAHSFAGVKFGTRTAEAQRRLTLLLGRPTEALNGGCRLGGPGNEEHARYLTWGHLTAHLSDQSRAGRRQAQQLVGWDLKPGWRPFAVRLPHGIGLGASLKHVRAASHVIRAGLNFDESGFLVETDSADYLFNSKDGSGGVIEVSRNVVPCD